MTCTRCASDRPKGFSGELAIHFPGLEGLSKTPLLVYPNLTICLGCGYAEFDLPEEKVEQLRRGLVPARS